MKKLILCDFGRTISVRDMGYIGGEKPFELIQIYLSSFGRIYNKFRNTYFKTQECFPVRKIINHIF